MTTLRTILLGAGKSGTLMYKALKQTPQVDVVGVASAGGSSALRLTSGTSALALDRSDSWLALDPDLVVIATPHDQHLDQIGQALSAGATVICDKPVALNASDYALVSRMAKESGRAVYCTLVQRCSPQVLRCHEYVFSRRSGLRSIHITQYLRRDDLYYKTWKGDPAVAGGGVIINQAIHALDLAQFVAGLDFYPIEVVAKARTGLRVETTVTASLRAATTPVTLTATTDGASNERQCIRFCFEKETVLLVGSEIASWVVVSSTADDAVQDGIETLHRAPDSYGPGYNAAVRDIVYAHVSGGPSKYRLDLSGIEGSHQLVYRLYERLSE